MIDNVNCDILGSLTGCVKFIINQLKVRSMLVNIERRESITPSNALAIIQTTRLGAYEIMDGCPAGDVIVPIRIPLSKFEDLTPSAESRFFTIKYFLNVTILDTEDRKYFKQAEIKLFRKQIGYEH